MTKVLKFGTRYLEIDILVKGMMAFMFEASINKASGYVQADLCLHLCKWVLFSITWYDIRDRYDGEPEGLV